MRRPGVNLRGPPHTSPILIYKWQRQTQEPAGAVQASSVGARAGWRMPARPYPDNCETQSVKSWLYSRVANHNVLVLKLRLF